MVQTIVIYLDSSSDVTGSLSGHHADLHTRSLR